MNIITMPTRDEDRETQIILVSDLLARTAQKPLTPGNMARVNNLARKLAEMTNEST